MYEITSNSQKHTHSETLSELGKALAWLEKDLGLRVVNTRIQNYFKLLDKAEPTKDFEKYKQYLLTKKEVDEFVFIYRAFKGEAKENIYKQVEFAISGTDYRHNIKREKSEPARDYLHELSIAARLKLSGVEVETNNICDVVAKFNNKKIYIECKRVKSKNKVLPRIKEANKQIAKRIGLRKNNAYGYITVDVTDLLCIGKNIEEYDDIEHFKTYSKIRLGAFSKEYGMKIRSLVSNKICSVIFYAHILGSIKSAKANQLYNVGFFYSIGTEGANKDKISLNFNFQPHLCK